MKVWGCICRWTTRAMNSPIDMVFPIFFHFLSPFLLFPFPTSIMEKGVKHILRGIRRTSIFISPPLLPFSPPLHSLPPLPPSHDIHTCRSAVLFLNWGWGGRIGREEEGRGGKGGLGGGRGPQIIYFPFHWPVQIKKVEKFVVGALCVVFDVRVLSPPPITLLLPNYPSPSPPVPCLPPTPLLPPTSHTPYMVKFPQPKIHLQLDKFFPIISYKIMSMVVQD